MATMTPKANVLVQDFAGYQAENDTQPLTTHNVMSAHSAPLAHLAKPEHPIVGDRIIEGDGTSTDAWQHWQGLHDLPRLDIAKSFPPQPKPRRKKSSNARWRQR